MINIKWWDARKWILFFPFGTCGLQKLQHWPCIDQIPDLTQPRPVLDHFTSDALPVTKSVSSSLVETCLYSELQVGTVQVRSGQSMIQSVIWILFLDRWVCGVIHSAKVLCPSKRSNNRVEDLIYVLAACNCPLHHWTVCLAITS